MKIAQQHRAGLPGALAKAGTRSGGAEAEAGDGGGDAGSGDDSSDREQEGRGEGAAAAGEGGGRVSLARTLHDILANMPPEPPGMGPSGGGAAGEQGGDEGEEEEGGEGLRSWCGAAEVGMVAAANVGEGARQRKRQRQLLGQAGGGGGEPQQRAKWASAKAQQRIYRWGAWGWHPG